MGREFDFDALVVGSGPAGLAAALACRERGISCAILERGNDLRSRRRVDPEDIASGVGGAGLFSDGKFSFYPSATKLWELKPESDLREAYRRVREIIENQNISTPPFPVNHGPGSEVNSSTQFESKNYVSKYMPLHSRYALVESFRGAVKGSIRTNCSATRLEISHDGPVTVEILDDRSSGSALRYSLSARALIIANGRLGPLFLQQILPGDQLTYQRLEVGFRIQQPAEKFFLQNTATLDPKRIWRHPDGLYEWRTFCCCRNGEIVSVLGDSVLSVSGRADIAPTEYSSVGFHVRVLEPTVASAIWGPFRERVAVLGEPIVEPLLSFLRAGNSSSPGLDALFGPDLVTLLKDGLGRLLNTFEEARDSAILHAPAIEGVLYYPRVDHELRLRELPVWVAGDATGQFRGITAALVSGYFSGIRLAHYLETIE